jgi:hypothetical protein
LEASGIAAHVADANTAMMDWQLVNALGGIRLQVAKEDYANALDVLQSGSIDVAHPEEGMESPSAPPMRAMSGREMKAERAAKMALLSLMLPGLQFYAAYLLFGVWRETGELRPMVKRQLAFAAVITFFWLPLGITLLVLYYSDTNRGGAGYGY